MYFFTYNFKCTISLILKFRKKNHIFFIKLIYFISKSLLNVAIYAGLFVFIFMFVWEVFMFVFNVKIHNNWLRRLGVVAVVVLLIVVFFVVGCKFYGATAKFTVNDDVLYNNRDFVEINASNYADVLKDAHNNVGKKVRFCGFVYRLYDFSDNQFVLGREMILGLDGKSGNGAGVVAGNGTNGVQQAMAVVVGFLCKNVNKDIDMKKFDNMAWVEVEGTIVKGEDHGSRPVIEVTSVKKVSVPSDEFVCEPGDGFVEDAFGDTFLNHQTLS